MKLKRVFKLLCLRRLKICRKLFRYPYRVFWRTCLFTRKPFTVEFRSGRSLVVSRSNDGEAFWDWLFSFDCGKVSMSPEDEYQINLGSSVVLIGPGTSDWITLQEVNFRDVYRLRLINGPLLNVLDLGANVGYFSCAVMGRARRVVAVEAVRANCERAARQIALNGGNPQDVLHYAVAGRSGEMVKIYHGDINNSVAHSMDVAWVERVGAGEQPFELVRTISLTDLLNENQLASVDLLKCDVEGAEFDIFLNSPVETLGRIRRILMEVHVSPSHPSAMLEQLISHLQTAGFSVERGELMAEWSERSNFVQMLFADNANFRSR